MTQAQDPLEIHNRAQLLAREAEAAIHAHDPARAASLYSEAAELQRAALAEVPADKLRTRGIMGVSLASLLLKAARLDAAERSVCGLLGEDLLPSARTELRELLEVVWEEQVLLRENHRYTGDEIEVALRGGRVGSGTAPSEDALHFIQTTNAFVTRITEWKLGQPFRKKGQPVPEIRDLIESRATQPMAGSYRFSLRLVGPRLQPGLFDEPPRAPEVGPGEIAGSVLDVVRCVAEDKTEELSALITDKEYRVAIMKLARNVVPAGEAVDSVELSRPGAPAIERVQLRRHVRSLLGRVIRDETLEGTVGERVEVRGTLRALDLDKKFIAIDADGRQPLRISREAALDDVLGPLVNRRVVAVGTRRNKKVEISDIEPAD